ncbi:MAG: hypothetical protein COZ80_02655 [Ignavibacteria bacterium CG_4_8_14_3_um_filter_37_9]|nr:MAG: hypothetical protein AUJ54_16205 [Ignavibacteria bacterium CG1_02_37_35]PIS45141.1 MAG: hypothetical protein COT22_06745 [Ignavibacteria bacterium CG08_land_8_20_14_0_20_37_9]PIW99960.1 MAG: hypothetical protein COZ80_02655 [Ignavibacteria bacterium CG_4_8_14_3_um_filter_37_9]PIX95108.1 MAG: hypothetical protein COZ25_02120 [Ignavibacteria bacterium CG_4_10_14_3_um_filter_37_18]PJC58659.1 MAG: hypothetical protein CO025_08655 [Ignavibacteria bacterium CG_4_9_14_0_2_um_filter_37_13]
MLTAKNARLFKMKYLFFILFSWGVQQIAAQNEGNRDSLSVLVKVDSLNFLETKLNKLLSTYQLQTNFLYTNSFSDFSFFVKENYGSTLIRSADKSIKDEHFFSFGSVYHLNENISGGFAVNHSILSDSRKIGINSAEQSSFVFVPRYTFAPEIFIAPFAGYSSNRQIGVHDDGILYGGEGGVKTNAGDGFELVSSVKIKEEAILPRKNNLRDFGISAANKFSEYIGNILTVSYFETRKDFYYEADSLTRREYSVVNNIQSRKENNFRFDDSLKYFQFLPNTDLNLHSSVLWRKIFRDTKYKSASSLQTVFDTEIHELKLDLEGEVEYHKKDFHLLIKSAFTERDEKHSANTFEGANPFFFEQRNTLESQKNNFTRRTSVTILSNYYLSTKDNISLSLFHNKLTYDTPSRENYDDRDELLSIVKIRYTRLLNPYFEFFTTTEGTINNLVYISSQRSSNNNVNRVLKLKSGGTFSGQRLKSYNSFEVSANYTVYDYEDLNPNYKSYSFRQFEMLDSTSFRFLRNIDLKFKGYLRHSEQGELKWKEFSLKPTRFLEESFFLPQLAYFFMDAQFVIGYRQFSLKTFTYEKNEKVLDSYYVSRGPVTELYYSVISKVRLQLKAWYEFVTLNQKRVSEIPNLDFAVILNI